MNDELGYDGQHYASLTLRLRGIDALPPPREPLGYRVAPAAIVAASGLDVRVGFLALDFASLGGAALVLLALLRHFGAGPRAALLGVALWALLPFTTRAAVHTPILTDAPALFIGSALLLTALTRRYALFAVLLASGALTRESLLLYAPCAILAARRDREAIRALAASIPAFIAFAVVRAAPPVAPDATAVSSAGLLRIHLGMFLLNFDGAAVRHVLALPLSLGVVLALPLARASAALDIARREAAWALLALLTPIVGVLGGTEPDRYDAAIAPLLLIAALPALTRAAPRRVAVAALVVLQVIACRSFLTLGGDTTSHFAFSIASMPLAAAVGWAAVAVAAGTAATLLVRQRAAGVTLRSSASSSST